MLVLSGEGCSNDDFDVLPMASVRCGIDVTVLFGIMFLLATSSQNQLFFLSFHTV